MVAASGQENRFHAIISCKDDDGIVGDSQVIERLQKLAPQIIDSKWAAAGETASGWKYTFAGGPAGYDPGLRAALTKYEVGAQLSNEVLYTNTSVDDLG